ncbi:MAG: sortase [Candidatus Saccharibacteria bacterium]|nr:sortase [Candidatus Saccharibacteria bacterium]
MNKKVNKNNTDSILNQRKKAEQLILQKLNQSYGKEIVKDKTNNQETYQPKTEFTSVTNLNTNSETNVYNQQYNQAHQQPQSPDWQAYHSAWQNYYQKYYAYYYAQAYQKQAAQVQSKQPNTKPENQLANQKINPRDQALQELRSKLREKMSEKANKVRRSRHFWPLAAAFASILLFLFLQYNRLLIGQVHAYITPTEASNNTVVVDPTINIGVSNEPRLMIPKINVNVPVAYDIGNDNDSQQEAMKHGVAHFAVPGASSHPGEIGNTAISGHSSNDVFEAGDYKFIFAQIDKLNGGDLIYADYKGIRYTYKVTKKEVVWPNEWEKLVYPVDKPVMTLITCTPIGTTRQRLLVTAEQISPDPSQATTASAPSINISQRNIPGESSTFLEKLFGLKK